jgi:enduracididine biosynthesis enzyme MppP
MIPSKNLTEHEIVALDGACNVSDGHARQPLTAGQQAIIDHLPELFREAKGVPLRRVEHEAHEAFFQALGQRAAPVCSGRILTTYSSSVAIDILGRCLAGTGATVALIHPTFDNIPDLLRSRGIRLIPFEEEAVVEGRLPAHLGLGDCVYATTPNNPTGQTLDAEQLSTMGLACRDRGCILALDTSFRGFDSRAQFDFYELLDDLGVDYVVIEDTGKVWPTLELKLGFMACSHTLDLPLQKAYTDVLLSASPVIMCLVREFSLDAAAGGFAELQKLIATNRHQLCQIVADSGITDADVGSRVSVARLRLPEQNATDIMGRLTKRDVHVLACGPLFWAEPAAGEQFVRVALARSPDTVDTAAHALRSAVVQAAQAA